MVDNMQIIFAVLIALTCIFLIGIGFLLGRKYEKRKQLQAKLYVHDFYGTIPEEDYF